MADLDEIYSPRILEIAANISATERLARPQATVTKTSKLCGSTVTVDLIMEGETVTGFAQDVKACLLGQTSAALVARNIIGTRAKELREVTAQMRAMLKDDAPPPNGRWADLGILQPVKDYKARHTSTLLVFDAVLEAIDEIEQQRVKEQ